MTPQPLRAQAGSSASERYTARADSKAAAGVEEQIRIMRGEIRQLRQEVNSLREELRRPEETQASEGNTAAGASALNSVEAAPEARQSQEALADSVSMLQSQVAEQAQSKVESNSRMPIKIFGTVLFNSFYNTRAVDWSDVPSVVVSPSSVPSATGSLSASLRQSRIGMLVDGPTVGSFKSSGFVAVDFLGGTLDFQSRPVFGVPRLYYGFVRFESARTALEVGQDSMILAPENPTSLAAFAFPELFRAGNLYVHAPQIRLEEKLASTRHGDLKLALGMVAPVASYPGLDFPGENDSEAWQRPALQGRLGWQSAGNILDSDRAWSAGVSGHYGKVRLGTPTATSWAVALDVNARLHKLGVAGEGYVGQNLQSFGGGVGQPGKTKGGFIEGSYFATSRLKFNGGFGSDHLTKLDIVTVDLNRNTGLYGNIILRFTPEVAASFEYRHLVTRPFLGALRKNENLNLVLAYSF